MFRYHHDRPGRYLAEGSRLVQISQDPTEIARAPFGDAFLAPVADTLPGSPSPWRGEAWLRRSIPFGPAGTDRPGRMHPDTVFRTISDVAPEDAIHVVESTSTAEPFWCNVKMCSQGSYYSAAAGGLGFGLPAAVGIQLAQPAPSRRRHDR